MRESGEADARRTRKLEVGMAIRWLSDAGPGPPRPSPPDPAIRIRTLRRRHPATVAGGIDVRLDEQARARASAIQVEDAGGYRPDRKPTAQRTVCTQFR